LQGAKIRAGEGIGRKGRKGHPPRDAAAFFSGGQDPRLRGKECIVELMAADRWQAAATPSDPGTIGFHLSALYSNLAM